MYRFSTIVLLVAFLSIPSSCLMGQEPNTNPTKVAGKTLSQWASNLESDNEIIRLKAVKSLRPFGSAAIPFLHQTLSDSSDAVQYWSADALGAFGEDVLKYERAEKVIKRLQDLASKKEKAISLAASYAVFQIRNKPQALTSIAEKLTHADRGTACSAAEFLGKIGPAAKDALPSLEKQFREHKDYHVRGACQNAIRKIKKLPVM